jgi:hypothetical protein
VLFPTGFQELAGICQKVPQKMFIKAGYQEIFAEFVEGAKPSEAQWYSVKPLHKGIPSLADPGFNGRAPRVQNIRSLQKDFNDTISWLASLQHETEAAD